MSASKNKATNTLLLSEKRSLKRFFIFYIGLVLILITVLAMLYYRSEIALKLSEAKAELNNYAYIQTKRLKVLHHFFPEQNIYPRDNRFSSAIYDIEFQQIFSLLEDNDIRFDQDVYFTKDHRHIRMIKRLDEYYLGAYYLVVDIKDDGLWLKEIWIRIATGSLLAFIALSVFGFYLSKIFLKPMRESIMLLDRFIKDTTHELNTPLSAILANIEAMDTEVMVEKNKKKLNRIAIAARTVSQLYKDLTFMTLEQYQKEQARLIDLKELILNRVEYFRILGMSKNLTCETSLSRVVIRSQKRKIIRLIDNLISNAIKYNKRGGKVSIVLTPKYLEISDTGIGIPKEQIGLIFDRYMRFNKTEGGFGIGLSIVKSICDEFGFRIEVESLKGEGTKFRIYLEGSVVQTQGGEDA